MPSFSHSLNLHSSRFPIPLSPCIRSDSSSFPHYLKLNAPIFRSRACRLQRSLVRFKAFDDDSFGIPSLNDWNDNDGMSGYMLSSSEGEDSDTEISLGPLHDDEMPSVTVKTDEAFAATANRLAILGRRRRRHRIKLGVLINAGLISFLMVLLLFVDWCAWRIVRLPLEEFYLTRPFLISAVLVSCAGYVCVPLLYWLKIHQIIRKEGPTRHSLKKRTPTMGGLFFVPIGVTVARFVAGFSSTEVLGAAAVTLAFAAIGLLDDILSLIKNDNSGLSAWGKIALEVAVGTWFSFWLDSTSISSPYSMYSFL